MLRRFSVKCAASEGAALHATLTRTESKFSRDTMLLVRVSTVVPTTCSSHTIGALAALNTVFTASAMSGPMPSPASMQQHIEACESTAMQLCLAQVQ